MRRARCGDHLRLQCGAPARRRRCRPRLRRRGRSGRPRMDRIAQVARETGYLEGPCRTFRGTDTYGYLPRDKVVALCTGSQASRGGAVAHRHGRASRRHPRRGRPRDLVLAHHPGQRKRRRPRDQRPGPARASRSSTDRTHLVHCVGHPRRAEVADLYSGCAPHRRSRPWRGAASVRARRARAQGGSARRPSFARMATWCGWRRDRRVWSTRCRGRLYKDGPSSSMRKAHRRRTAGGYPSSASSRWRRARRAGRIEGDPAVE